MGYIQSLDIPFLYRLTKTAHEREQDKELYELYLALLPVNVMNGNATTFKEWKERAKPKRVQYDMRSKDEIMEEILNNHKGGEN